MGANTHRRHSDTKDPVDQKGQDQALPSPSVSSESLKKLALLGRFKSKRLNSAGSMDSNFTDNTDATSQANVGASLSGDNKKLTVPSYITRKLSRKKNLEPNKDQVSASDDQLASELDNKLSFKQSNKYAPHSSPKLFQGNESPLIIVDEHNDTSTKEASANSYQRKPSRISQDSSSTAFFSFHRKSSDFGKVSTPTQSHSSSFSSLIDHFHSSHNSASRRSSASLLKGNDNYECLQHKISDSAVSVGSPTISITESYSPDQKGGSDQTAQRPLNNPKLSFSHHNPFKNLFSGSSTSVLPTDASSIGDVDFHSTNGSPTRAYLDTNTTITPSNEGTDQPGGFQSGDDANLKFDITDILSRTSTVKFNNTGKPFSHSRNNSMTNGQISAQQPGHNSFNNRDSILLVDTDSDSESVFQPFVTSKESFAPVLTSKAESKITGLGISGATYNRLKSVTRMNRPKDIVVSNYENPNAASHDKLLPSSGALSPSSFVMPLSKLKKKTFSLFTDNNESSEKPSIHIDRFQEKMALQRKVSKFHSSDSLVIKDPENVKNKFSQTSRVGKNRLRSNSLNDKTSSANSFSYRNTVSSASAAGLKISSLASSTCTSSRENSSTPSRKGSISRRLIRSQQSLSKPTSPLHSLSNNRLDEPSLASKNRRRSQTLNSLMNLTSYGASKSKSLERVNEFGPDVSIKLKTTPKSFVDLHGLNKAIPKNSEFSTTRTNGAGGNFLRKNTASTSNLNEPALFSTGNKPRSRANSVKSPFGSFGIKFFTDNFSSSQLNTAHVDPFKHVNLKQYAASFGLYGTEVEPPKPDPSDTCITYVRKLIDSGFSYGVADILSSHIPTHKYPSSLSHSSSYLDSTVTCNSSSAFLARNFEEFGQREFYSNCLYLYTYLYFLNMYYGENPLYGQSIGEEQNPILSMLQLQDKALGAHSEDIDDKHQTNAGSHTNTSCGTNSALGKFMKHFRQKDFTEYHIEKVFALPVDILLRHFLFFNKLPLETEKIDLVLEVVSFNYFYFTNLNHLKSIYADSLRRELYLTEEYNDAVIIHKDPELKDGYDTFVKPFKGVDVSSSLPSRFTIFNSENEVYMLLFTLLVLLTDHFNKNNKQKMLQEDFVSIINNFKTEDFEKAKKGKEGAKIAETEDTYLLFNLLTREIIEYFYENITMTPLKSVQELLAPVIHSRNSSVATAGSFVGSPTSPSFLSNNGSGSLMKKKNSNFFGTSSFTGSSISINNNSGDILSAAVGLGSNNNSSSAINVAKSNDPYSLVGRNDVKSHHIDFDLYKNYCDPFKSYFDEFIQISQGTHIQNMLKTLNATDPPCVLKLDHPQDISNILFTMSQATIKTNASNKEPVKSDIGSSNTRKEAANANVNTNAHAANRSGFLNGFRTANTQFTTAADMPMFVRIYKIGVVYKQEAKYSILPKRSKKRAKRRSKNFKNVNLDDGDTFVWKKYYAMLTTFGIYIFKSVNWNLLTKFESDIEHEDELFNAQAREELLHNNLGPGSNCEENNSTGEENSSAATNGFEKIDFDRVNNLALKRIKVYSSSFFLQSSNSELELNIPIDKLFAYKYRYKSYNSFYICYNKSSNDTKFLKIDEVDATNEWMNNPKSNKVYNKGLFYSESNEDVNEWVYNINYLAALHKCLPVDHNEAFTNLTIPGYGHAMELTIGRHSTLVGRHKELYQELKMISKLKLNFEKILEFVKRLTPYQTKTKLRLKKLVNKIYTNNFRSLWFEKFKIKTFIHVVEQTIKLTAKDDNDENDVKSVCQHQRKMSEILMNVQPNVKYLNFCKVVDLYAVSFRNLVLESSEAFVDSENSNGSPDNDSNHGGYGNSDESDNPESPQTKQRMESFNKLITTDDRDLSDKRGSTSKGVATSAAKFDPLNVTKSNF